MDFANFRNYTDLERGRWYRGIDSHNLLVAAINYRELKEEFIEPIIIEEGTIIEVSTPDSVEDNYRVLPGDSQ